MDDQSELICAYSLDGKGSGLSLDWATARGWTKEQGPIWIHLDATHHRTETWFKEQSGLSTFNIDGMLASETRPRYAWYEDGILLNLRGVNLNPGADPEDLVSVRIWIEEHRVITTKYRRLLATEDVQDQIEKGRGPLSTGHLVARLAGRLTDRMGPIISDINDQVAELEELLIGDDVTTQLHLREFRHKLIGFRRQTISLRRYVAPQRDALNRMAMAEDAWIDEGVKGRFRETVDQVTRITEDLDEARERSAVVQDELMNRISQRMERTMYTLTMVATIVLPLGFLTGLLGINVGGMPGMETKWAFWAVCGGLGLITGIEIWLFKKFKWL